MRKGAGVFYSILLALLTMVIIVAIFVASVYSRNYDLMREADIYYNSGDYSGALARYNSLKDAFRFESEAISKADYCNYNLAAAAMEEQDWDAAREYLGEIKAYSPEAVNRLLAQCDAEEQKAKEDEQREKEQENDKAFLADLERAIIGRLEDIENKTASEAAQINGELGLLERYRDAEFSDARLKGYAIDYLNALQAQRSALGARRHSDRQLEQQEAIVQTCGVVNRIYQDYQFMADNDLFLRTYIASIDSANAFLSELREVNADLLSQTDKVENWTSEGISTLSHVFKNNTPYSISLDFYLDIYNLDNSRCLGQDTARVVEIPENTEYRVTLISGDAANGIRFNVDWIVTDIR
ncbi:MAG: hypothetical protein IJV40_16415 [Oscillospiraceae bacterium]|nr:hypothetical protein [Oscillospiraceae bacterium]